MTDIVESISTKYFDELIQSTNPGLTLVKFYCSLFDKEFSLHTTLIGKLGKMSKVFGRNIVFYSILDIFGMETVDLSSVERLIYYFCKKRFIESVEGDTNLIDLTGVLAQHEKRLLSTKSLKVIDPFIKGVINE